MVVGTKTGDSLKRRAPLYVFSGESAANTAQTISTDVASSYRILHVETKYSAAPTQTGVTVTLNSAVGSAYDTLLVTGTANAQNTSWIPEGGQYIIGQGDALDVLAPAGGATITSAISIYVEAL